jgi:hypothetical protein
LLNIKRHGESAGYHAASRADQLEETTRTRAR